MKVRPIIVAATICFISGCITFSFGTQEEPYNFSATYYMDGRCEVELPNRDREYVFKGMYFSDNRDPSIFYMRRSNTYSLVCSYDERGTPKKKAIVRPRISIKLLSLANDDKIEFIDDNHVVLEHEHLGGSSIIEGRENYRFIQREQEINLSARRGRQQGVGIDKYFGILSGARYEIEFRFKVGWYEHFFRQLPGVTRQSCIATFLSTDLSLTIKSRDQARETGIYAKAKGTNGTIEEQWCK